MTNSSKQISSKQIWTGPVLGTNRDRLLDKCAEHIRAGQAQSILYIAASAPLLNLVTDLLLDGERTKGVWGALPVYLFRGFVRRLLETAIEIDSGLPIGPRLAIDTEELPMRRGLVAQIIRRLNSAGHLKAIHSVAHRDGTVSTVSALIGEIERAATGPVEFESIIEARRRDQQGPAVSAVPLQRDYDSDIALIYKRYVEALDRGRMTEEDADQLRAVEVLRGELNGLRVSAPWLDDVKLLVLDGFFDFTPVQGEMLRLLLPRVPEVVVNLNFDDSNPSIFVPFEQTIHQLEGMAAFQVWHADSPDATRVESSALRTRLFNDLHTPSVGITAPAVVVLECADRETEIRRIAKEIKRLVLILGYRLSDIALVIRERAAYADAISRVLADEQIPCALGARTALTEMPPVRAALKLLRLLSEMAADPGVGIRMSDLSGLIKSDYFRPSHRELLELRDRFYRDYPTQALDAGTGLNRFLPGAGWVGRWDVDNFENVIAYVGGELRLESWLRRARQLTAGIRSQLSRESEDSQYDLQEDESAEVGRDEDLPSGAIDSGSVSPLGASPNSRRKPARDMHPAAIAWAGALVEHLARVLSSVRREGSPRSLRDGLTGLFDRLEFADRILQRARRASDSELRRAAMEVRALEGMRRAMNAALRVIGAAGSGESDQGLSPDTGLAVFIDEVTRALRAQTLEGTQADRNGVQVLEATAVRGLKFRAVFIAGLIEGGFPLRASRDWLYPHEERERLKGYGLTLEDISPETLLKEEHYFYQAACRATERLYLSRPLVLEDATETVASYYIEELKRAAVESTTEKVRRDFDGSTIQSASTGWELATEALRAEARLRYSFGSANGQSSAAVRLISWAVSNGYLSESALRRAAIERERSGRTFGRFDGQITRAELIALALDTFGVDHVFSASELSLYGKCPFKFFAQRVLGLEPRGEAAMDLTALDAGSLLHEILRRFLSLHRNRDLTSIDRAVLSRELAGVADEVFDEHERRVPPLNPNVWRIDREIRKIVLDEVLTHELELQRRSHAKRVTPAKFELAFGMRNAESDPASVEQTLVLSTEGGEAKLRGQIDRVDLASDGTVIAYDYKLSKGAGLEDLKAGRDLQLHIYLAALEQLFYPSSEIAGGGYYVLRGAKRGRKSGLYRASKSDYTGMTTGTSVLSDEEWHSLRRRMQSRIFEFIEGARGGSFKVYPSAPGSTCSYCDFRAACRYDKFRISRKAV
ncbi:MAG TPA: PD-(D/E)XK nuclease family protein [Blastocatellia bacterium]|nr:PD-(D/E)XK nuclease family protein [Blastocatellia bacterium]